MYVQNLMQIGIAQMSLVFCAAFYLVWWWVFFKPSDNKPEGKIRALGIAAIVLAAILGCVYIAVLIISIKDMTPFFPPYVVALVGLAIFLILLLITWKGLKRKPTVELPLICLWATLEASMVNALGGSSIYGFASCMFMLGQVTGASFFSLICYCLYYRLSEKRAFYVGAIPLILIALAAFFMSIVIA